MNAPNGTGSSRWTRTGGLALLALAVIAVLIGVVAVTCEDRALDAGPPPATSTHTPGSASAAPSAIPFPPPVTSSPVEAPEIPTPVEAPEIPATGPADGGVDSTASDKGYSRGEVRVYNNSTIRGLAARAADDLTAAGWTVVEVGNYARGTIPTTTAYYQEGTDQRDDAEALGAEFGMRVEPRFSGIANADPGLIVIVTNDYVSP
ncbi:MAG: LytR C-terminal domain-containing protein [Actinomycetota bacterium]|nr:LytR C-terminal domain-containing protein [Actinomycetota bacterium]